MLFGIFLSFLILVQQLGFHIKMFDAVELKVFDWTVFVKKDVLELIFLNLAENTF